MVEEFVINQYIRPLRTKYSAFDLGSNPFPSIYNDMIHRKDFQVFNNRRQTLQMSLYHKDGGLTIHPCVIYLHCNTGSRIDALPYIPLLIRNGYTVCAFDFSGSGNSDGKYVTLGKNEKHDIDSIIQYLENMGFNQFFLWGRSMGAVTALLYIISMKRSENVIGMVLDSPFASLRKMSIECGSELTGVPEFLLHPMMLYVNSVLNEKTGIQLDDFEIKDLLKDYGKKMGIKLPPALFLTSHLDKVVKPYHVEELLGAYPGKNKQLKYMENRHDQERGKSVIEFAVGFINEALELKRSQYFLFQSKRMNYERNLERRQQMYGNLTNSMMVIRPATAKLARHPFNGLY
jgi:pimeloyl-ACP methyl ester carboxylesterase